jgi:hypothetical protein
MKFETLYLTILMLFNYFGTFRVKKSNQIACYFNIQVYVSIEIQIKFDLNLITLKRYICYI